MRIISLSTSKKICGSLKKIANENETIKYDCVEEVKDLEYYLDICNYDFILINSIFFACPKKTNQKKRHLL